MEFIDRADGEGIEETTVKIHVPYLDSLHRIAEELCEYFLFVIQRGNRKSKQRESLPRFDNANCGELIAAICPALWFLAYRHRGISLAVVEPFRVVDSDVNSFPDVEQVRLSSPCSR